jgi:AcrR family transcriptional regulator
MKIDARVRYTKMVIKDNLLRLLTEKPIKQVTVKEICAMAQINRATFYTHYQDPYDLLGQIENELFEDISSTVAMKLDNIPHLIQEIFKIIEKNIDLCRVLFSENGDKMFLRQIMDISREKHISTLHEQYPQATECQLDYLFEFVASGAVAVVSQWVRSGMNETPQGLGEVIKKVDAIWLQEITGAKV